MSAAYNSKNDSKAATDSKSTVFVANLAHATSPEKLKMHMATAFTSGACSKLEVFTTCANILSVTIPTHKSSGNSKGYGFVAFATVEDAEKAIKMLNGSDLLTHKISMHLGSRPRKVGTLLDRDYKYGGTKKRSKSKSRRK
jgi:RNA recognition motif-containing protein